MFGFDSFFWCSLGFLFFWVPKPKKKVHLLFWMAMINQDLKNNYRNYKDILGLVLYGQVSNTKKKEFFVFFLRSWLIISIQKQKQHNCCFPFQNQNNQRN